MALVAERSKAAVLLMVMHCLLVLPLFDGVLCLVLVLFFSILSPSFAVILMGKRKLSALL